jgi:hypothetical protein
MTTFLCLFHIGPQSPLLKAHKYLGYNFIQLAQLKIKTPDRNYL